MDGKGGELISSLTLTFPKYYYLCARESKGQLLLNSPRAEMQQG